MHIQSTVNKVMLVGRILTGPTSDVKNGETTHTFCMATKEEIRKNGHIETIEELHYIKARESVINIDKIQKQLPVYVQGRLQTVQYVDEGHVKRYKTFVIANVIEMLEI